jgi:hypothetical protein
VKPGPPGWQPDQITHRVDGFVVDPDDEEDRIHAMPLPSDTPVADTRARMYARHRKVFPND